MLTQQERDEVKRLVELGEPLPEKYRWKLFAEPRETELIWPGKTNEVTNVVLPFQTIEQIDEPRAEMEEQAADLFAVSAFGPSERRLDQQAHLGRQQAYTGIAEERAATQAN